MPTQFAVMHIYVSTQIPDHYIVTLGCGHKYLAPRTNPLLVVGDVQLCEACLRKEQAIRTITASGQSDEVTVNLTCGHDQKFKLRSPLNYGNAPELIGTTLKCSTCERLERV